MPRIARIHVPGVVQHVISRFVNGEYLVSSQGIRSEYLRRVFESVARTSWKVLSFGIMGSHGHLALLSGVEPLDRWILAAHSGFASWINRCGRRQGERTRGPVFAERPTVVLFEPDRVAHLIAYIHNNPVRAGVVPHASASKWTSHRAYVGAGRAPDGLDVETGLALCGFSSDENGRRDFADFVDAHRGVARDSGMTAQHSRRVRAAARAALGGAIELAAPTSGGSGCAYPIVWPSTHVHVAAYVGSPDRLLEAVALVTGVADSTLRGRRRTREVVRARRLAIRAWSVLGRRLTEIGRALGLSVGAVSKVVCRSPVPSREEPEIAQVLSQVDPSCRVVDTVP